MEKGRRGMGELLKYIKEYFFRVRWAVMGIIGVAFMSHGAVLFSQSFGIDTDFIINGEDNFGALGRQGLVWVAKLLDLDWFNLYYAQVLAFTFMVLAPVSFGFLLYRMGGGSRACISLLFLGVSFVVSPFWAAQVYFLNQSAQVLFACVLAAVSIYLAECGRQDLRHRWYCVLFAVLLAQAAFGCYQVLVMVYAAAVAAAFLASSLREERTVRQQLQWVCCHIGVFFAGFLVYFVIAKLFFMGGKAYLEGQLDWAQVGLAEGLKQCFTAVGDSLKNNPPYYTGMYGVFALFLLSLTIYRMVKNSSWKKGGSVLFLLAELFLILSPYAFIFFYGKEIPDRMQVVMPLSQGCILYLSALMFPWEALKGAKLRGISAKGAVLLFAAVFYKDTVSHLNYCNRFYYTYDWVFQYDAAIAEKLYMDIEEARGSYGLEDSYDKLLFLGYPDIPYNPICCRGLAMGSSFFQIDIIEARPYRNRILCLMRSLGYPEECNYTDEEIVAYRAYFEQNFGSRVDAMPCYPDREYIQYLKDDGTGLEYLVVKLGELWRPKDVSAE